MKSLLILCLLTGVTPLAVRAESNTLTPEQTSAGWRLLFDGRSLDGWRSLASPTPGAGWAVVDGALTRTAKSGDIVTVDEFSDFELSLDWKVEDATNSGILYRVGLNETRTWRTGPEFQVLDNHKAKDRFNPKHSAGGLYDLVAPSQNATKPVGEWNHARIVVRGWHIEHWLNGVKVVDVDLGTPEGRALIAGSKFKTMPHFATLDRGHIALQDEENMVSYRNIMVRELAK